MTDDEIWALNRGGHDPHKVYAAYARGGGARGPADRDPGQDDQGLRHGRGRRGPEHHPPAEEDGRGGAARLPRPLRRRRSADDDAEAAAVLQAAATTAPEMDYLRERREALGGSLPARRADAPPTRGAAAVGVRGPAQGHRRARDLDDDGVRPGPQHAPARQGDRPARRADRARRVAHLRHGGDVPPARDLLPGRPALHARGRRPAHVLPGGQARPDPAGGHQRGRARSRRGSPRHLLRRPRRRR